MAYLRKALENSLRDVNGSAKPFSQEIDDLQKALQFSDNAFSTAVKKVFRPRIKTCISVRASHSVRTTAASVFSYHNCSYHNDSGSPNISNIFINNSLGISTPLPYNTLIVW